MRRIPFSVDFSSHESLTEQIVRGFKQAIAEGRCREGDRLPTRKEVAAAFGVSLRVPREAFRRLKADGCVVARPRLGCFVSRPKKGREWKGHVLYVFNDGVQGSFSHGKTVAELQRRLARAGWALDPVAVNETRNAFDFSAIETRLGFEVPLALVDSNHPKVSRWFEKAGIPYLSRYAIDGSSNFRGYLPFLDASEAIGRFVERCRRAGVRNVLQTAFSFPGTFDAVPALRKAGIACERWCVPPLPGKKSDIQERIRDAGYVAFARRFGKSRETLPDVLLLTDDVFAAGALFALVESGIVIPRDVRVVTLVNRGNRPVFGRRLAAIVNDPAGYGDAMADGALATLAGRPVPEARPRMEFEAGETFPI